MPTIYEDTRQQMAHGDKHAKKHEWFAAHGVECVRRKLEFGDYMTDGSNIAIDTKANVGELAMNVGRDHRRFAREMERAREAGYRLVIMVETVRPYVDLDSLAAWTSSACRMCLWYKSRRCLPHGASRCAKYKRKPIQGTSVARICKSMERDYGCRFTFVHPDNAAESICDELGVEHT